MYARQLKQLTFITLINLSFTLQNIAYPNDDAYHVHHAACDHAYPVRFLNRFLFGCLKRTIHSYDDLISQIDEI